MGSAESDYQLGADPLELERLNRQGRVLAPATRMILEAAGICDGMRVLDLGSGMGDMAFVAAELVGPMGQVVGIDRSPEPVAKANLRARQQELSNVRFLVGEIHDPAPDGPYDAIVGRLVLMYVPDPAAVLRAQTTLLRPGGVVVPIEFDLSSARSIPTTPLVAQVVVVERNVQANRNRAGPWSSAMDGFETGGPPTARNDGRAAPLWA